MDWIKSAIESVHKMTHNLQETEFLLYFGFWQDVPVFQI